MLFGLFEDWWEFCCYVLLLTASAFGMFGLQWWWLIPITLVLPLDSWRKEWELAPRCAAIGKLHILALFMAASYANSAIAITAAYGLGILTRWFWGVELL